MGEDTSFVDDRRELVDRSTILRGPNGSVKLPVHASVLELADRGRCPAAFYREPLGTSCPSGRVGSNPTWGI